MNPFENIFTPITGAEGFAIVALPADPAPLSTLVAIPPEARGAWVIGVLDAITAVQNFGFRMDGATGVAAPRFYWWFNEADNYEPQYPLVLTNRAQLEAFSPCQMDFAIPGASEIAVQFFKGSTGTTR